MTRITVGYAAHSGRRRSIVDEASSSLAGGVVRLLSALLSGRAAIGRPKSVLYRLT